MPCVSTATGCEVVALGTGNYNAQECLAPNGRILHDSHAVVTARRSLMRSVILSFVEHTYILFGIINVCYQLCVNFQWEICWVVKFLYFVFLLENYRFYIMASLSIIYIKGFHSGVWGAPGGPSIHPTQCWRKKPHPIIIRVYIYVLNFFCLFVCFGWSLEFAGCNSRIKKKSRL